MNVIYIVCYFNIRIKVKYHMFIVKLNNINFYYGMKRITFLYFWNAYSMLEMTLIQYYSDDTLITSSERK